MNRSRPRQFESVLGERVEPPGAGRIVRFGAWIEPNTTEKRPDRLQYVVRRELPLAVVPARAATLCIIESVARVTHGVSTG